MDERPRSELVAARRPRYPPLPCTTRFHQLARLSRAGGPDGRVEPGSYPQPVTVRRIADIPRTFALARSSCRIRALLCASPHDSSALRGLMNTPSRVMQSTMLEAIH